MISLLSYTRTHNLGDAIQTIAMSRLIGVPHRFRDRDNPEGVGGRPGEDSDTHICNGYLDHRWTPQPARTTIFAGVHMADKEAVEKFRSVRVNDAFTFVGARDPYTADVLSKASIRAETIGCATLTFPRYHGPREGVLAIDVGMDRQPRVPKGATYLTNALHESIPWVQQWRQASELLERLRTAEEVYTNRLHVLLPCLAFGTPVRIFSMLHDPRFSIARELGVQYGKLQILPQIAVTAMANRFREYVAENVARASVTVAEIISRP